MDKETKQLLITIIIIIIGASAGMGIGMLINKSIERAESLECQQWFIQSENYVHWYATDWQKEQCQRYGFDI